MTTSGYALVLLTGWTLLGLLGFGASAARAARRALRTTDYSPAQAWAREVQRTVRLDGDWSDGECEVWQDLRGWWHLADPTGAVVVPPSEVQCELVGLFFRRAARAARDAAGGVA